MSKPAIADVSDTALWVAVYRARETERSDALFKDPWATRLAGDRGQQIAAQMSGSKYTSWSVVIRTCIIDSYLKELVADGVDTVMNLGAGLDTRPYRMGLPPTLRWIEVDYPHMIRLKDEKLAGESPSCRLERMALDLADLTERRKFFAKVASESKKTAILTEGVIPYLTSDQVISLSQDLRQHPSYGFWILDYYSPQVARRIRTRKRLKQMKNAPFQFFPEKWFEFFEAQGWKARETRYLAEESERLKRTVPMPWWAHILRWLDPSANNPKYKRFSGYVLLEPLKKND